MLNGLIRILVVVLLSGFLAFFLGGCSSSDRQTTKEIPKAIPVTMENAKPEKKTTDQIPAADNNSLREYNPKKGELPDWFSKLKNLNEVKFEAKGKLPLKEGEQDHAFRDYLAIRKNGSFKAYSHEYAWYDSPNDEFGRAIRSESYSCKGNWTMTENILFLTHNICEEIHTDSSVDAGVNNYSKREVSEIPWEYTVTLTSDLIKVTNKNEPSLGFERNLIFNR